MSEPAGATRDVRAALGPRLLRDEERGTRAERGPRSHSGAEEQDLPPVASVVIGLAGRTLAGRGWRGIGATAAALSR
jgi:hypothetical protein